MQSNALVQLNTHTQISQGSVATDVTQGRYYSNIISISSYAT